MVYGDYLLIIAGRVAFVGWGRPVAKEECVLSLQFFSASKIIKALAKCYFLAKRKLLRNRRCAPAALSPPKFIPLVFSSGWCKSAVCGVQC